MTISRTAGGPRAPTVGADITPSPAAPGSPPLPTPTHASEGGLLDRLKRKLLPGPSSVAAGPFYLRTSIAPLRMPANPGPAVELPTGTEFRPATSQWIQDRSVELVDRLHPGIQAAASASGTADAIGATPRPTRDLTQAAMRVVASAADFASATAALFTRGAEGIAPSPAIQRLIDARPARNWPSIRAAWSA